MTGILMTFSQARIIALEFAGTNCAFTKRGRDVAEAKIERHNLAEEKLQKTN